MRERIYWQKIEQPKRVIDKIVDAIQLTLAQRRTNRVFKKEFDRLYKEQK